MPNSYTQDNATDIDVIYLGNTSLSKDDCLEACIDSNFLCDVSSLNEVYKNGQTEWIYNDGDCSIRGTLSGSQKNKESVALVADISADEYIIELNVSVSEGRDVGIIFKANDPNIWSQVGYGIDFRTNEVIIFEYPDNNPDGWDYAYYETSPISLQYDTMYSLKVHVIGTQYMAYLNEQQIFSSFFLPSYSGNYAGIYMYDVSSSIATVATFHSFTVSYPNSNDAFLCTAYTFDTNSNECYGYYGNDYDALKNSLFEDADYQSAILYNTCPPTNAQSAQSNIATIKNPTAKPSDGLIQSTSENNKDGNEFVLWLIVVFSFFCLTSLICIIYVLKQKQKENEMIVYNNENQIAMNDIKSYSSEHDDDQKDVQINAKILLTEWKLEQYAKVLYDKGYEQINDWKDLTLDDLKRFGFKEGHSKKFRRKTDEYLEYMSSVITKPENTEQSEQDINVKRNELSLENDEFIFEDEGVQTMKITEGNGEDLNDANIASDEFIVYEDDMM